MKKILIFTVATGQGHNQAASAIKQLLSGEPFEVMISDPLDNSHTIIKKLIKNGYLMMADKTPSFYGKMYTLSNKEGVNPSVRKFFKKALYSSLEDTIQSFQPDLVISTHPLLNENLSVLKNAYSFSFVAVLTDYMAHRSYAVPNADAYIVGSEQTACSLHQLGVNPTIIHPFGIPVSNKFFQDPILDMHKEPSAIHGTSGAFNILIMGGSMGFGLTEETIKNLLQLHLNLHLHLVCGTNKKLYSKMTLLMRTDIRSSVSLYSYCDHIHQLMDICKIIISKPGGLTVTEALIKNKPMIIPFFIPGQEEENARFLHNNHLGVMVQSSSELNQAIEQFVNDPFLLHSFTSNLKKVSDNYSMEKTKSLLIGLVKSDTIKAG